MTTSAVLAMWWDITNCLCGLSILLPLAVLAEGVNHATERMVFYTRAHNVVAEDRWNGAVPACCTCCLMLGYCDMVDEIA